MFYLVFCVEMYSLFLAVRSLTNIYRKIDGHIPAELSRFEHIICSNDPQRTLQAYQDLGICLKKKKKVQINVKTNG